MATETESELERVLARMVRERASLVDLLDVIHETLAAEKYSRGLSLNWLTRVLPLRADDYTRIVFACEVFGHGATVGVAETEARFARRLAELEGEPIPRRLT